MLEAGRGRGCKESERPARAWGSGLRLRGRGQNLRTHAAKPVSANIASTVCSRTRGVISGRAPGRDRRETEALGTGSGCLQAWQGLPAAEFEPSQFSCCAIITKTGLLTRSKFSHPGGPSRFGMIRSFNSFPSNRKKKKISEIKITKTDTRHH